MAEAVADTFERSDILLAEAGTGTGKTLAYLVPAVLSGRRVLISTGTKNLQEQIFFKDLPVVRDTLKRTFRAAYMKGRGNYLCLHRYDAFRSSAEIMSANDRRHLALLEDWVGQTTTGDRAEVEDLPEDVSFWSEIAATSENCLGTVCPRYQDCFVTKMRQAAAEADIVIVNHHLLCADAAVRESSYGEVIPACSFAIVDEAHQLEDVATQYFGLSVSSYRLAELVRDGERLSGLAELQEGRTDLDAALDRVRERSKLFFHALALLRRPSFGSTEERVRVVRETLEPVREPGDRLSGALDALSAVIGLARSANEDLRSLAARATGIREELEFLIRASDSDFVYFVELRGRGVFLRAAPIDVSRIVRELLLDRMEATILTSATLTVDGSFSYLRERLGIANAREVRLPAEFDYAQQAILYLPRRVPDPRAEGFPRAAGREIAEILRRTEGRAFVLFTSYANLREVHLQLAGAVDYPLLVQGTGPRSALLREFRETRHAVLLATSSFWQGVDVMGDALSCVIIDKLPFASPADPITAARMESIALEGGDPFNDYQVPLAILTLLQGLGRLIRHRNDRGVLAILDPRLQTKGYGRRFLASLPPAPVTDDLRAIERFFHPERRVPRPPSPPVR
jgi:ATP-dependent DNA helicase DinG